MKKQDDKQWPSRLTPKTFKGLRDLQTQTPSSADLLAAALIEQTNDAAQTSDAANQTLEKEHDV